MIKFARQLRVVDGFNGMPDRLLGSEISSFAYPYGAWDGRCVNTVREVGYCPICTTHTSWALRGGTAPPQLCHLTVFNTDTTSSLARKPYFGSNDVSWHAVSRYALQRVTSRMKGRTT
ncbi:hypothetical protein [Candidatus Nitrotoga arctica]|uniref:Uncharacterized protein n=1 Tax=Candidatus Nitrotoga arctica TaxID=453162 RepID=A0ABN8ANL5_9PROT|nr:hypothetical protein [Candidatus Nitrotoga arctica]CAG9932786.1 protein of unknown function [Candidatus Nitrotoga arctica]